MIIDVPDQALPGGIYVQEAGPLHTGQFFFESGRAAFVMVDVWDNHHIDTFRRRADKITREKIVPALAAARHVGMNIVHAPSGPTSRQESGCHEISHHITYRPGEYVHGDPPLHRWFKRRGVTHVVYVGFATNICLIHRPYGVRKTHSDGYEVLVLRDATTGVEYPDTLDGMWATRVALREIERSYGHTALTEDFIRACKR